jgi:hypothetical protein
MSRPRRAGPRLGLSLYARWLYIEEQVGKAAPLLVIRNGEILTLAIVAEDARACTEPVRTVRPAQLAAA